jgi:hypothetical protein
MQAEEWLSAFSCPILLPIDSGLGKQAVGIHEVGDGELAPCEAGTARWQAHGCGIGHEIQ